MSKNQLSKAARALQRRILSDDEIRVLMERFRDSMDRSMLDLLERHGVDPEEHLRFMAVASRVVERRDAKGLDIKTVARELKVPQYRLRDIEEGHVSRVVPTVLASYVDYLGLKTWFGRWKKKNPGILAHIGL